MKIWGDISKVQGVYKSQNNTSKISETQNISKKKDVISISETGKDYQTAVKALKDVPNIRQDKVDTIKKVYESGKYDVSGNEVAEKIINSIFDKKI